ncbi:MAG: hypothetical protein A2X18_10705 [Bacteroidetes bacterium GWF2_40_14]|nr:MAG: hypothetical protein A2X18_10705 [Bacteroidetes bacterium GWF2_40_14]
MKNSYNLSLILIFLLVSLNENIIAQNLGYDKSKVIIAKRALNAKPNWYGEPDSLLFTIGRENFLIHENGNLFWGEKSNNSVFLLSEEDPGLFIDRAYYHKQGDTLFLFVEESNMDEGMGGIIKINLEKKKIEWRVYGFGFNMGYPYIIGSVAYVTSIGGVGKLNLITGKFIFKYNDLYDSSKYSFNYFDTIAFKGNFTYFISKNMSNNQETVKIDTVIVNELTKQITIIKK